MQHISMDKSDAGSKIMQIYGSIHQGTQDVFKNIDLIFTWVISLSRYSGRESPCILLHIPDGHVKETHKAGSKHKPTPASAAPPAKKADAKEVCHCEIM